MNFLTALLCSLLAATERPTYRSGRCKVRACGKWSPAKGPRKLRKMLSGEGPSRINDEAARWRNRPLATRITPGAVRTKRTGKLAIRQRRAAIGREPIYLAKR